MTSGNSRHVAMVYIKERLQMDWEREVRAAKKMRVGTTFWTAHRLWVRNRIARLDDGPSRVVIRTSAGQSRMSAAAAKRRMSVRIG